MKLQAPRLPPDFLSSLVVSMKLMRLSLEKAAYVVVYESSVVGNQERSRGICSFTQPQANSDGSYLPLSYRPERSEVQGPAVSPFSNVTFAAGGRNRAAALRSLPPTRRSLPAFDD